MRHRSSFIAITIILVLFALGRPLRVSAGALSFTQSSPPSSQAAQALAESRRAEIASYAASLKSADEEERRNAALMLGAMNDPATVPALRAALADAAERVRAAALAALGNLRDPALVPLIATYLTKDKRAFVRKTAAYALGQINNSGEATAALILGLRDKDMEVRGAAAVALANTPDATAIAPLIHALKDKSPFVRAHAATALGVNGRAATQAVPDLIKVLTTDEDHEARRQAATALGRINEPSALPALERAAHSSDPYLSQSAREAINRMRSQ
ncbi:MAG TPA: HEAT repeat domain-containing protein [Blastocatellia bacterium]|nr:HEAT repeat domain-containing protein [Blastocatellia bacterium]